MDLIRLWIRIIRYRIHGPCSWTMELHASVLPLTCAHASCEIKTCITFHLVYRWTDTCMLAVFVLYNNGHYTLSRAAAQYCVDRNVLPSVGCSSAAVITVSNTTRCCTSQVKVRPNCYRLTRSTYPSKQIPTTTSKDTKQV